MGDRATLGEVTAGNHGERGQQVQGSRSTGLVPEGEGGDKGRSAEGRIRTNLAKEDKREAASDDW